MSVCINPLFSGKKVGVPLPSPSDLEGVEVRLVDLDESLGAIEVPDDAVTLGGDLVVLACPLVLRLGRVDLNNKILGHHRRENALKQLP